MMLTAACTLGLLWLLTLARNITLTQQRDDLAARLDLALPERPFYDQLAEARFADQLQGLDERPGVETWRQG